MNVGVMITNGGPHPPGKWAAITASRILDIASTASGALLVEAQAFQMKLEAILAGHHTLVQAHERSGLVVEGPARLASEIDTSLHVPDAVDDVIAATKGTNFAEHFAKPEVLAYLARLLHEHFHLSMQIERSWHADAHPDHPHAIAFRERIINGVGASVPPTGSEGV